MKAYRVIYHHTEKARDAVYHENINAAIKYFLMDGKRGVYLGNMTNDWDNFKEAGAKLLEYEVKEIV